LTAPTALSEAMILAAGRGERMRPVTDRLPKPLVVVRGAPLIEHHIRKLVAIGIKRIVINVSYLADALMGALGDGSRFGCELIYSLETELLETGGGVAKASRHFLSKVIVLVSADVYSDFDYARLLQPAAAIEKAHTKAHFVMVPSIEGEPGGEFSLDADGYVSLGRPRLTLASIGCLSVVECQKWPRDQRFALLPTYQQWTREQAVTGQMHHGLRVNVTTFADVEALNGRTNPHPNPLQPLGEGAETTGVNL
jgi:N-acetyl-alpha-D-muramate 1-phosphate uridylyltransferase